MNALSRLADYAATRADLLAELIALAENTDGTVTVQELRRMAAGKSPEPNPDFFQPGHTYTRFDGTTFQCFTVTTTPWNGQLLAVGWHTDDTDITSIAWRGIDAWRHEYDGGEPA